MLLMKITKIFLILQAVGMYVMHLPLYIMLIIFTLPNGEAILENAAKPIFISFLVLLILVSPLCLLTAITSIVSIFKGNESPAKTTMIIKLALIPWYVLNFYLCIMLIAGFLNPWLMLATPIVAAILICSTYIYMLATSLPDIAYLIRLLIKKKIRIKTSLVFAVIFLFIFCLDIIGGLMFYIITKDIDLR